MHQLEKIFLTLLFATTFNACIEFPSYQMPLDMEIVEKDMKVNDQMIMVDQKVIDQMIVIDQVIVDQTIVDQMIVDQMIVDQMIIDQMIIIDQMLPPPIPTYDVCQLTDFLNDCPCETGNHCPSNQWLKVLPGITSIRYYNSGFSGYEDPTQYYEVDIPYEYYLSQTEITVESYQKCLESGSEYCQRCDMPGVVSDFQCVDVLLLSSVTDATINALVNPKADMNAQTHAQMPLTGLTWRQANAFCKWLGNGRLPSDAEWQLAAKGPKLEDGKYRKFPWNGERITCNHANIYSINGTSCDETSTTNHLKTVCTKNEDSLGFCDLLGNAEEFVLDDYLAIPFVYPFPPNQSNNFPQFGENGYPSCITPDCDSLFFLPQDAFDKRAKVVRGSAFDFEAPPQSASYLIDYPDKTGNQSKIVFNEPSSKAGFRCAFKKPTLLTGGGGGLPPP